MKTCCSLFVVALFLQTGAQQNPYFNTRNSPPAPSITCPEKTGRFATSQCDAYIECEDGKGEEKLCPDGLLFNPALGIYHQPCQYPVEVDCSGREATQPPQSTEECPHRYGYFRIGDAANCGQFKNCVDGRAYVFDCPEGLAFDEQSLRCDWPDQVSSCDAEAYLGFTCPPGAARGDFDDNSYTTFRSADCHHYYICVNSRPRLYNCGKGRAFNELINACDGAENVTGCASATERPHYTTNALRF
ncbi:hypothetical protein PPYR_14287 [Photinus pyralis]|uniref:Chitin-binding type-2 domain-containing protein n=3 Tax=Photinus pyralis TaxID=7054 RepID=A0A5N4A4W7_PHOPY|nr:hypothetical protein PPYR_14287 [Photinus pyralis]